MSLNDTLHGLTMKLLRRTSPSRPSPYEHASEVRRQFVATGFTVRELDYEKRKAEL